jgi:hypothetical protein
MLELHLFQTIFSIILPAVLFLPGTMWLFAQVRILSARSQCEKNKGRLSGQIFTESGGLWPYLSKNGDAKC